MVNRSCVLVVACVVVLAGCAAVRTINLDDASDDTFYELNAQTQRLNARITLAGYPPMAATDVQVAADTTSWRDPRTGRRRSAPTAQIQELLFRRNRMWRGAAVGAAFGAGVALAAGRDCSRRPEDEECISRIDLVPMSILLGGLVGGIVGARSTEKYRFEASAPTPAGTGQQ